MSMDGQCMWWALLLSTAATVCSFGCSSEESTAGGAGAAGGDGGGTAEGWGMVLGFSGTLGGSDTSMVTAGFSTDSGGTPCIVTNEGACSVSRCSSGSGGAGPESSAGTVSVVGGLRDVALLPKPDGSYDADISNTAALFTEGQSITMAGSGAEVPAFSEILVAPSQVDVVAPDLGSGAVTLQTASDLTVSWTNGNHGDVSVVLSGGGSTDTVTVTCIYDATVGEGVVPASTLSPLKGISDGTVSIGGTSTAAAWAGSWLVALGLSAGGVVSGAPGQMATATATYQ